MSQSPSDDTSRPDDASGPLTDSASSELAETDESRDEASDPPDSGSRTKARPRHHDDG